MAHSVVFAALPLPGAQGEQGRLQQHQRGNFPGVAARQLQGDLSTGTAPDHHGRGRGQSLQQRGRVLDVIGEVDGFERFGPFASVKAPAVINDAPAAPAEHFRSVLPQQR